MIFSIPTILHLKSLRYFLTTYLFIKTRKDISLSWNFRFWTIQFRYISFSPLEEIQDPSGVMARGNNRPG